MQLVNVSKKNEFTDRDIYGVLIQKYNNGLETDSVIYELFSAITQSLEKTYNIIIEVNWKEEVVGYLSKKKEQTKKRKPNAERYNSKKNMFVDEEEAQAIQQWMMDIGITD
ncbi:hypothetical protein M3193_14615 [Sporosarcina luteola]|uniref:hypothetical protein n=1 Tax=Sporosarcina luteola TaxID=582850 RepID=UPI0020425A03|nr:hypothetical protein [Sporosarcina luteola]MCM3745357.1 hypothetical protein [Sporosarcina luteola]